MIHFTWHTFSSLTVDKLYEILSLRSDVFVVEQKCVYQDPDRKDQQALHLLGIEDDALVAYLRLFLPSENNNYLVFGRVVMASVARKKGYGKKLMQVLLNYCDENFPRTKIKCSAQLYLKKFYEAFGFQSVGDAYDEEGILHIQMVR